MPFLGLLADKTYDTDAIVEFVIKQGATVVIPPKSNRVVEREYDKILYKERNWVEHVFAGWKTVFKKVRVSCRGLVRVSAEILGLAFGYHGRRYGFLVRGGC